MLNFTVNYRIFSSAHDSQSTRKIMCSRFFFFFMCVCVAPYLDFFCMLYYIRNTLKTTTIIPFQEIKPATPPFVFHLHSRGSLLVVGTKWVACSAYNDCACCVCIMKLFELTRNKMKIEFCPTLCKVQFLAISLLQAELTNSISRCKGRG